ncbi:hypothetical protein BBJ28_00000955 [Nothophytophthora sp. Chile5]|nr:hypothetical protein BBJ28_00000955 [Nothophytophthora sp. Chile5]
MAPTPPPTRPGVRRNLTYREKVEIVRKKEAEPDWTQRSLSLWAQQQFGLEVKPTQATISNILRAKDRLLTTTVPPEFRSARRVKHPELDLRMIQWVLQELRNNVPLTRGAIQSKAIALAQEMQLPSGVSFSKGWVSSFMNRHQLNFIRRPGDASDRIEVMHPGPLPPTEAPKPESETGNASYTAIIGGNGLAAAVAPVPQAAAVAPVPQAAVATPVSQAASVAPPKPTGKRRRTNTSNVWESCENLSAEDRATLEVLLDWVVMPGSYARWRLQKNDAAKEPLCEEINLFLRSHGLRGMSSTEIRVRLTMFATSFQVAHSWLDQTGVAYPTSVANTTPEQVDAKSYILQLCPHYEVLAPVLVKFTGEGDDSEDKESVDDGETQDVEMAQEMEVTSTPGAQEDRGTYSTTTTVKAAKQPRRRSTGVASAEKLAVGKAQRQRLFELECERLKSDIETKNVQLMLEKTLARKKLLDAGISQQEVDRIFPL